jgi:hypothetical protein
LFQLKAYCNIASFAVNTHKKENNICARSTIAAGTYSIYMRFWRLSSEIHDYLPAVMKEGDYHG